MKLFSTLGIILALLGFYGFRALKERQATEVALARLAEVKAEIVKTQQELQAPLEAPVDLEVEILKLEKSTRELHRLRGEINQLRQQTNLLNELRNRNANLKRSVQSAQSKGTLEPTDLGFTPLGDWQEKPFRTPEDAVAGFMYYFGQADVDALFAHSLLASDHPPLSELTEEKRAGMKKEMREFGEQIRAYRIAQIDRSDEQHVTVRIQTAVNGEMLPLELVHVDGEWKFDQTKSRMF